MRFHFSWLGLLILCSTTPVCAINIVLDYSHDLVIDSHPVAKSALEAAASDFSHFITTELAPIESEVTVGVWEDTSLTIEWIFAYNNPTTQTQDLINSVSLEANEVRIFVGGADLGGALGLGGPAVSGANTFASGPSSDWERAVDRAAAIASETFRRGGGPVTGTLSDSLFYNGASADYSVETGVTYGSLAFNNDVNQDNLPDSISQLESTWHFDHKTPVPDGKYDFYTVMLHELAHAIGFGGSQSWQENGFTGVWTGQEVGKILGPNSPIQFIGGHTDANVADSPRVTDGLLQEPLLAPILRPGERKRLTLLDLAYLRDSGYETLVDDASYGDFSDDRKLSVDDLDQLITEMAIGAGDTRFDLNGNRVLENFDVLLLLRRIATQDGRDESYIFGDINLDGTVDAQDLNQVGLHWTQQVTGWSKGDVVPDGVIDAKDLNVLGQVWLQSNSSAAISNVPEGRFPAFVLLTASLLLFSRRRHRH